MIQRGLLAGSLLAALTLAGPLGCGGSDPTPTEVAAATDEVDLDVEGMTCGSCEMAIKTALGKLPGVVDVVADAKAGTAHARFDGTKVSAQALAEAVSKLGYTAKVHGTAGTN